MGQPNLIIPDTVIPPPNDNEIAVAKILANHYKTLVEFIAPQRGYKIKTPDIIMNGLLWEIKSPTGSSRNTIEVQVKSALRQSSNIILDGRLTKIEDDIIHNQLEKRVKIHKRINRIILISKKGRVIEVYKKR